MKKFLKDSFSNGNRYTNIMISIITGLLLIIGFFLRNIYADFKDVQQTVNKHEVKLNVIETNLTNHITK